jgi:hypothetical protein
MLTVPAALLLRAAACCEGNDPRRASQNAAAAFLARVAIGGTILSVEPANEAARGSQGILRPRITHGQGRVATDLQSATLFTLALM